MFSSHEMLTLLSLPSPQRFMTMPDWQDTSLGDSDAEEEREETVSNSHPAPSHPSPTPSDPHSPKQQYAAQTTLLLIEATPTMLDPRFGSAHSLAEVFASSTQTGDRPRSKLEIALRFVLALVKKRMVGSPKDKMGIMLFNTVCLLLLAPLVESGGRGENCCPGGALTRPTHLAARFDRRRISE